MSKLLSSAIVCAFALALAAPAAAQDLPRPSPLAKVSQTVGLTDVTVEYFSPAAKGRKVWGTVVPTGKLWRMGANAATKLTVSKDVTIGGKPVPAGTYALFAIPGKGTWTIIVNKNPNQGGTAQYKQELDQARFEVKAAAGPNRERMTFIFSDTTDNGTNLDFEWAGVKVRIPIVAGTDAEVQKTIAAIEAGAQYRMAARYFLDAKKDYDRGLKLIELALKAKEDFFTVWTKAQLLAASKKPAEACPVAKKAKELGEQGKHPFYGFFADDIKKSLVDWKCK